MNLTIKQFCYFLSKSRILFIPIRITTVRQATLFFSSEAFAILSTTARFLSIHLCKAFEYCSSYTKIPFFSGRVVMWNSPRTWGLFVNSSREKNIKTHLEWIIESASQTAGWWIHDFVVALMGLVMWKWTSCRIYHVWYYNSQVSMFFYCLFENLGLHHCGECHFHFYHIDLL